MFAVIAIVMGIAASAFTAPKANFAEVWFTIAPASNPNLASSYTYAGVNSPCEGVDELCAIKGTEDIANPGHPLQADVNMARSASSEFTTPVEGKVDFKNQ